jgi:hypothetical protein
MGCMYCTAQRVQCWCRKQKESNVEKQELGITNKHKLPLFPPQNTTREPKGNHQPLKSWPFLRIHTDHKASGWSAGK